MSLSLKPLADALGVEATGVDLSAPVSDEVVDKLKMALREKCLLVVRNQHLSSKQYLAAVR